jgi:hypothetical protein
MIDRALRILVLVAAALGVAVQAAPTPLPADPDGSPAQTAAADAQAGKASGLQASGVAGATAPGALPGKVGTGVFVSAEIGDGGPGDGTIGKTPAQESKESPVAPGLQAFDSTANGFLRLPIQKMPAYSVLATRVFVFRERDLYTKGGMVDLSFKRHPGLHVGNQFKLNEKRAYEMFMGDDWRATKSDYKDMAHAMALGGDRLEGMMILEAVDNEDLQIGAEGENGYDLPTYDSFLSQHAGGSSGSLELTEIPVDFTVIRLKW